MPKYLNINNKGKNDNSLYKQRIRNISRHTFVMDESSDHMFHVYM